MTSRIRREDDESVIDLTPMIDLVFLLLVFFLLTSRFVPEEKYLAQLLPTDGGQRDAPHVTPPEVVAIAVYPAQFVRGCQPSSYERGWRDGYDTRLAAYRMGNHEPLVIDGSGLDRAGGNCPATLTQIHTHVAAHLAAYEDPGPRCGLPSIVIHGFSGLPWKYVIAAYDAVRAWEERHETPAEQAAGAGDRARQVSLAPPRLRNYQLDEAGQELWEILHLH